MQQSRERYPRLFCGYTDVHSVLLATGSGSHGSVHLVVERFGEDVAATVEYRELAPPMAAIANPAIPRCVFGIRRSTALPAVLYGIRSSQTSTEVLEHAEPGGPFNGLFPDAARLVCRAHQDHGEGIAHVFPRRPLVLGNVGSCTRACLLGDGISHGVSFLFIWL